MARRSASWPSSWITTPGAAGLVMTNSTRQASTVEASRSATKHSCAFMASGSTDRFLHQRGDPGRQLELESCLSRHWRHLPPRFAEDIHELLPRIVGMLGGE